MPIVNFDDIFAPTQAIPSMSSSGVSFMDQYYGSDEIPPAPEDLRDRSYWQEASQGASRGLHGLKSAGYGVLGIGASVLGADESRDKYFQQAREQEELAKEHPAAIPGYEDINSIGDVPRWFMGLVGEQVPNIAMTAATTLATGGIGALVSGGARASAALAGSAVVKKTIAEQSAKLAAKSSAEAIAKGWGAKEAAGISSEIVKTFLPKATSSAIRSQGAALGAKAGMVAGTAPIEAGGSWVENMQEGLDTPWTSIGVGTFNGFVELLGGSSKLANLVFNPQTKSLGMKALGHTVRGIFEMGGEEAGQEALQEITTILGRAANDPNFEPMAKEQVSRVINSALAGAAVGFGYGIPGAIMQRGTNKRAKAQEEVSLGIPQYVDPATIPPPLLSGARERYTEVSREKLPEHLMGQKRVEDIRYLDALYDTIVTKGIKGFTPEEVNLTVNETRDALKEISQNPIISSKDLSEIYNDPENPDLNTMMIEQGKEYQKKFKALNSWVKAKGKSVKGVAAPEAPTASTATTPGKVLTPIPPVDTNATIQDIQTREGVERRLVESSYASKDELSAFNKLVDKYKQPSVNYDPAKGISEDNILSQKPASLSDITNYLLQQEAGGLDISKTISDLNDPDKLQGLLRTVGENKSLSEAERILKDKEPKRTEGESTVISKQITPGWQKVESAKGGEVYSYPDAKAAHKRVLDLEDKFGNDYGARKNGSSWNIYKRISRFVDENVLGKIEDNTPAPKREQFAVDIFDGVQRVDSEELKLSFLREVLIPWAKYNETAIPKAETGKGTNITAGKQMGERGPMPFADAEQANYIKRLELYNERLYDKDKIINETNFRTNGPDIQTVVLPAMVRNEHGVKLLNDFKAKYSGEVKIPGGKERTVRRELGVPIVTVTGTHDKVLTRHELLLASEKEGVVQRKKAEKVRIKLASQEPGSAGKALTDAIQESFDIAATEKKAKNVVKLFKKKKMIPEEMGKIRNMVAEMYNTGYLDNYPDIKKRLIAKKLTGVDIINLSADFDNIVDRLGGELSAELSQLFKSVAGTKYKETAIAEMGFGVEDETVKSGEQKTAYQEGNYDKGVRADNLSDTELLNNAHDLAMSKLNNDAEFRDVLEYIRDVEAKYPGKLKHHEHYKIVDGVLTRVKSTPELEQKAKEAASGFGKDREVPKRKPKAVHHKGVSPGLKIASENLIPELRKVYPSGVTSAQLMEDGKKTGITRKKFANVGDTIEFAGVSGKWKVIRITKPLFNTREGINTWAKREGWSLSRIRNHVGKVWDVISARDSVQTIVEKVERKKPAKKSNVVDIGGKTHAEKRQGLLEQAIAKRQEKLSKVRRKIGLSKLQISRTVDFTGDKPKEIKSAKVVTRDIGSEIAKLNRITEEQRLAEKRRLTSFARKTGTILQGRTTEEDRLANLEKEKVINSYTSGEVNYDITTGLHNFMESLEIDYPDIGPEDIVIKDGEITIPMRLRDINNVNDAAPTVQKEVMTNPDLQFKFFTPAGREVAIVHERFTLEALEKLARKEEVKPVVKVKGKAKAKGKAKSTTVKALPVAKVQAFGVEPAPPAPVKQKAKPLPAKAKAKQPVKAVAKVKPVAKPVSIAPESKPISKSLSRNMLTDVQREAGVKFRTIESHTEKEWELIKSSNTKWIEAFQKYDTRFIAGGDGNGYYIFKDKEAAKPEDRGWKTVNIDPDIGLQTVLQQFPKNKWIRDEKGVIHNSDGTESGFIKVKIKGGVTTAKEASNQTYVQVKAARDAAVSIDDTVKPKTFSEFVLAMKTRLGDAWESIKQWANDLWNYVRYRREINSLPVSTTPELMTREKIAYKIKQDPAALNKELVRRSNAIAQEYYSTHNDTIANLWAHYKNIKFFTTARNNEYYSGIFKLIGERFDISKAQLDNLLSHLFSREFMKDRKVQDTIGLKFDKNITSLEDFKQGIKARLSPMVMNPTKTHNFFQSMRKYNLSLFPFPSSHWMAGHATQRKDSPVFMREVSVGLNNALTNTYNGVSIHDIVRASEDKNNKFLRDHNITVKHGNMIIRGESERRILANEIQIRQGDGPYRVFRKIDNKWYMLFDPKEFWAGDKATELSKQLRGIDESDISNKVSQSEPMNFPPPTRSQSVSRFDLDTKFPGATIVKVVGKNNTYNVTLPNGFQFTLINSKVVQTKNPNEDEFGSFGLEDGQAIMSVADLNSYTLDHETFHMVTNVFLRRGEQRMMYEASRFSKTESEQQTRENAANNYALWKAGEHNFPASQLTFFEQIRKGASDLLYWLRELFFTDSDRITSPEKLFEEISSGRIYNRAPQLNLVQFPGRKFALEMNANGLPIVVERKGIRTIIDPRESAKKALAGITSDKEFMLSAVNGETNFSRLLNGAADWAYRNNKSPFKESSKEMGAFVRHAAPLFSKATDKRWSTADQAWEYQNPHHKSYFLAELARQEFRSQHDYDAKVATKTAQELKAESVAKLDPVFFWGNKHGHKYLTLEELSSPGLSIPARDKGAPAFIVPSLTHDEIQAYLQVTSYLKDVVYPSILNNIEQSQLKSYQEALTPAEFSELTRLYDLLLKNKEPKNINKIISDEKWIVKEPDINGNMRRKNRLLHSYQRLSDRLSGIRKARATTGFLDGYFPQTRPPSSHYLNIYKKDLSAVNPGPDLLVYNIAVSGSAEANREWEKLIKQHPEFADKSKYTPDFGKSTRPDDSTFFMIGDVNTTRIIDLAIGKVAGEGKITLDQADLLADSLAISVGDLMKARGAGIHSIHRKLLTPSGIEGYMEKDFRKIFNGYVSGYYGMQSKMNAAMEFAKIAREIPSNMPDTYTEISTMMKDNLRNMDKYDIAIAKAKGFMFYFHLAGKISMVYMQLTQNFITAIPRMAAEMHAMGIKDGYFQAEKYMLKAMKEVNMFSSKKGSLDPDLRTVMEQLEKEGDFYATFTKSMQLEAMGAKSKAWRKTLDILSIPMKTFEEYNRRVAVAGMYHMIKGNAKYNTSTEAGKKRLLFELREFMLGSHFWYSKSNQPISIQGGNGLSRAGSLLYTFTSFPHNYVSELVHAFSNYGGTGGLIYAARSMAYLSLFGGLMALPWLDDFIDMVEKITNQPIRIQTRRLMEKYIGKTAHQLVAGGVPALLGIDLSNSIRPAKIPFYGDPAGTMFGVYGGMLQKVGNFWSHFTTDQYMRMVEDISPTALENLFKARRLYETGVTKTSGAPVFGPNGEPYKMDIWDAMTQALSFKPYKYGQLQQDRHEQQIVQQEWAKIFNNLSKRYWAAKTDRERDLVLDQYRYYNERIPDYLIGLINPHRPPKPARPEKGAQAYWRSS